MLTLLPRELLIKTNSVDHADWNYKTVLGYIQRKRFQLILSLIRNTHSDKILEIGYGSGIFMPALSKYCEQLYGIDIHPFNVEVSKVLDNYGVVARLFEGSVSKMPFVNDTFDLIISVSTFEFIDDKISACLEIQRVLKKNGRFLLITPAQSWILDTGFKLLTKENADNDFGNERQRVVPILKKYFNISKSRMFPPVIGNVFPVYKAYVLQLKDGERK
ncbi:MAG TPA: class I SAM-dependent methyltransferase [Ignavibacteria bacterium]